MSDTHTLKLESFQQYSDLNLDGTGFAETLKGSNITNTTVRRFAVVGGYEDCIDCVRGSKYAFVNGILFAGPKTRTFITLKGDIDGVLLMDLELSGTCRWPWDISLGDHTIYNKGKLMNQRGISIRNVRKTHPDRKVRVLVLDSEPPVVSNSNVTIIRIPRLLVKMLMKIKG